MGCNNAVVHHLIYKYLPSCLLGSATLLSSFGTIGGFIIPSVMGAISGYSLGYQIGWIFMAALGVLSLIIHVLHFVKFRHMEILEQPQIVWL